MIPWLHFTPGDILWFYGWVPSSTGAMVGTCIGLFLLALVDRWIAACRAVMEVHWSKRYVFPSLNSSSLLRTKSSIIVARMLLLELCRDYHPSSVRLDWPQNAPVNFTDYNATPIVGHRLSKPTDLTFHLLAGSSPPPTSLAASAMS